MHLAVVAIAVSTLMQTAELCGKVACGEGSSCDTSAGLPVCKRMCKTTCGSLVPHGWKDFDDGSNACNMCKCIGGSMVCNTNTCTGQSECDSKPCCRMLATCPKAYSKVESCTKTEFADRLCKQVSVCCQTITCKQDAE
ncbi:hypothetical protein DIPPA_70056 [Diplonema papillatum]|nr:hypothetical protein DIPPA_70056 [Diplonema papillatum]